MLSQRGGIKATGDAAGTCCSCCPARRSSCCGIEGQPRSHDSRGQAITRLKNELEAMESFYVDFGMPLERYARPHLLRVVTAVRRDMIELKRRLLELKDICDHGK